MTDAARARLVFSCLIFLAACLHLQPVMAEEVHRVKRVSDGDTIVLRDGRHLRYIGINAPEVAHENQKAEPFGDKAEALNRRLILGRKVRLEFDRERKDRYGRLLAYVFLEDGTFVNAALLARGYAYVLVRKPNVAYEKILLAAQRRAMSERKGIWHGMGETEGNFIGNRRSRRFHLWRCPFGQRTGKKNRIVFNRAWDAFWEGYAPGKQCGAWHFRDLSSGNLSQGINHGHW